MKFSDDQRNQLEKSLYSLRRATTSLKFLATLIVMILICSISSFIIAAVTRYSYNYFGIVSLVFGLSGIVTLYVFDITRRRGMIAYDVLSDWVEWLRLSRADTLDANLTKDRLSDLELDRERDPYFSTVRMRMRAFLQATDLPIIPGGFGQGLYLIIFIVLAIGSIVFFATPFLV